MNDACTTDRRIIKYWDYRKNLDKHLHDKRYPIDPFHASVHSSFKENFICFDCNYEWESTIDNFMQSLLREWTPPLQGGGESRAHNQNSLCSVFNRELYDIF